MNTRSFENVTGVLVTTGTIDIEPVVASLKAAGLNEIVIYNNQQRENYRVYGRYYAALHHAKHDIIYIQDDDCVVPVGDIVAAYQPGMLTCNMPEIYRPGYGYGVSLVGFGAVFNRELIDFQPYLERYPADELFYRECDRVFTYLNQAHTIWIDCGVEHRNFASDGSRMWKEPRHGHDLKQIRRNLENIDKRVYPSFTQGPLLKGGSQLEN